MPIFTGLRQRNNQPKTAEATIKSPHATLIESATTLLSADKRQQHLKNIKALLNLPPKLYQTLYQQAIEQFAEFVQSLPETAQGIFAGELGFLDHGLERAARALSLCLGYFFPQEKNFQNVSSQQALWVYAVFTAALLYDVGKLAVKYHIQICQKDGAPLQPWSPYTCSMVAQGKYYRYDFVKENRDNLRRLTTPLLARQILSEAEQSGEIEPGSGSLSGFSWIASDPDVLEAWLTLLGGNTRTVNSFLTVIPLADIQVIESHMHHIRGFGAQLPGMFNSLPGMQEDALHLHQMNDAFLEWLRTGIADQSISVNLDDSHVHTTAEGVVILDSIFNHYLTENPQVKQGPSEVARQFRNFLDLYQMSFSEQIISQRHHTGSFINLATNQAYLVKNDYLIFNKGQIPTTYSTSIQAHVMPHTTQPPTATQTPVQDTNAPQTQAPIVQSPTGHVAIPVNVIVVQPK